jgi:hypothetical protein
MRLLVSPVEETRSPEGPSRRRFALTPRRVVALVAGVLLVVGIGRKLRRARELLKHKRRLQLAFSVLVLLRQLRKQLDSR